MVWALPKLNQTLNPWNSYILAAFLKQAVAQTQPLLHLLGPTQLIQLSQGLVQYKFDPGIQWARGVGQARLRLKGSLEMRDDARLAALVQRLLAL